MKQLYYTSCRKGKSVNGHSGFQVRAVSAGVPSDAIDAVVSNVSYVLPEGMVPSDDILKDTPVRLALINVPFGRLLCHSIYVGRDPETQRWGNFFSHAVLALDNSEAITPRQAIASWGSDFWQTHDNDKPSKLPEAASPLPAGDWLNQARLVKFLAEERHRQLLEFVLTAWLTRKNNTRIFLAAPDKIAAMCLYALTRALPDALFQDLSFSTYEKAPLLSRARITASWWPDPNRDLPSACFGDNCLGYHLYKPTQRSRLNTEIFCVKPIVTQLATPEEQKKIRAFVSLCHDKDVDSIELVDLVYRMHRKKEMEGLSQEDSQRILQQSALAEWAITECAKSGLFLHKVAHWARTDPEYYEKFFPIVVRILAVNEALLKDPSAMPQEARDFWYRCNQLHGYTDRPSFRPDTMNIVAPMLKQLPEHIRQDFSTRLVAKFVNRLYDKAADGEVQKDLEYLLLYFGSALASDKLALYTDLLQAFAEQTPRFYERVYLLEAFFSVALGAVHSPTLSQEIGDRLIDDACQLYRNIRNKPNGKKSLVALRSLIAQWPTSAQELWHSRIAPRWRFWLYGGLIALFLIVTIICSVVVIWSRSQ